MLVGHIYILYIDYMAECINALMPFCRGRQAAAATEVSAVAMSGAVLAAASSAAVAMAAAAAGTDVAGSDAAGSAAAELGQRQRRRQRSAGLGPAVAADYEES